MCKLFVFKIDIVVVLYFYCDPYLPIVHLMYLFNVFVFTCRICDNKDIFFMARYFI